MHVAAPSKTQKGGVIDHWTEKRLQNPGIAHRGGATAATTPKAKVAHMLSTFRENPKVLITVESADPCRQMEGRVCVREKAKHLLQLSD